MAFQRSLLWLVVVSLVNIVVGQSNAPPGVDTWCGKPYMSSASSINPGGQFVFPAAQRDPLLYITVQPRYTIFLDSDKTGSFIVGAAISHLFGETFETPSPDLNVFKFQIYNPEIGSILVSQIPLNSTKNLLSFSLSQFPPRLTPYPITLYGTLPNSSKTFKSTTQIYVLPSRIFGSAVKIDNLHGGLLVQNHVNSYSGWYPIFPNGYYADGSSVTPSTLNLTNLNSYASHGFNTINIVPDGGLPDQSYPISSLSKYWDRLDELNLFNIYDMRFAFQNSTRISEQVELWKNRSSLLMWYTADEPDGWVYALNSTKLAYDLLRSLDPYHPVSLVLNCQDFYYEEYSSGADLIWQDAYPVGINATYSIKWNTPCNETYGDCGCDNCIGSLSDVSMRLDDIQAYQSALPYSLQKPTWSVLQAFGEQDYWPRLPTVAEILNMMILSVNHGAKGITYWIYPSTNDVNTASGALGKVLGTEEAMSFLFGTEPIQSLTVEGGSNLVDASAWVVGGKVMVGVANGLYFSSRAKVKIALPEGVEVKSVEKVLYGNEGWKVEDGKLVKVGLQPLEIGLLVLS